MYLDVKFDVGILLWIGANPDVEEYLGRTPLQEAEEHLAKSSNPEKKRSYEKVCQVLHAIASTLWL